MHTIISDRPRKILMISPYRHSQRGNSITSMRLKTGLEKQGFMIDWITMEESDVLPQLQQQLDSGCYGLIHAFHALHWGRLLDQLPQIQQIPVLLTTTGTDLHFDLSGKDSPVLARSLFRAKNCAFSSGFHHSNYSSFPVPGGSIGGYPPRDFFRKCFT